MGTITLTDAVAGTTAAASLINNNNSVLENVLNAGIDDANLESSKIITGSTHFKVDGGTAGQVYAVNAAASAWAPTSIGAILAFTQYNPTTVATVSTGSTTSLVDVDATNAKIVFTPKSTGNVLFVVNYIGTNPQLQFIGFREDTTDVSSVKVQSPASTARLTVFVYVAGITLAAHTYKLAQKSQSGSAVSVTYGTQASPASGDPGPLNILAIEVP